MKKKLGLILAAAFILSSTQFGEVSKAEDELPPILRLKPIIMTLDLQLDLPLTEKE